MGKFIKLDFQGYIFNEIRKNRLRILLFYSNWINKLILYLKNIKFGRRCKFFGISYFHRNPGSRIIINEGCSFRSDRTSNLIGINRKCILSTHSKNATIQIGKNCGFSGVTIGAYENITIGDNFLCGANVIITDYDWHNIEPDKRQLECINSKPVIINDNVFIGVNSIIWKGVTIGKNTVIGANSVVTKSIPENVVAAGNPCRVIRQLF
jgi:acetyltransferase-like isoleucine patch superfamily enzyme